MSDVVNDSVQCPCGYIFHGDDLDQESGKRKPCPKCGSLKRVFNEKAEVKIGIKASVSATHKPKWSSESLALFFGFLAIFLAVVIPGILMLLPFSPGVNYGILVGFLVVAGLIFWWQRYCVLMLIRWVEGRFGGEKRV